MANNFKVWVDNGSEVMTSSAFINDNERKNGFKPNTPAHSSQMNTALRQANLIACALMDLVAPNDNTTNVQSNVDSVKNVINTGLTNIIKTTSVNNSTNVTTNINGKSISSIFESNGTTVKKASNADIASYASSDTSKGTIEERLTRLGFKSGGMTISSNYTTDVVLSTGYSGNVFSRQGNYVMARVEFKKFDATNIYRDTVIGSIPQEFRPKQDVRLWITQYEAWTSYPSNISTYQTLMLHLTISTTGDVIYNSFIIDNFTSESSGSSRYFRITTTNYSSQSRPIGIEAPWFGYEAQPL